MSKQDRKRTARQSFFTRQGRVSIVVLLKALSHHVFRTEQEISGRTAEREELLPEDEEHAHQQGAHCQHQVCYLEGLCEQDS